MLRNFITTNLRLLLHYLVFVFIAAPLVKKQNKKEIQVRERKEKKQRERERRRKGERNQENKIKGGKRERKGAEKGS